MNRARLTSIITVGLLLCCFHKVIAQPATTQQPNAMAAGPGTEPPCVTGESKDCHPSQILELKTFEDNFLSNTNDSDDDPFLEIKISVTHKLGTVRKGLNWLKRGTNSPCNHQANETPETLFQDPTLNFAFTGRFGQYLSRYSAPVVGKRFNPSIFLQWQPKNCMSEDKQTIAAHHDQNFLRLAYGHESNGQSISDFGTFNSAAIGAASPHPNQSHVPTLEEAQRQSIDYISRGWDYFGLSWTSRPHCGSVTYEVAYRRYMRWGIFEHNKEEYRDWEKNWSGQQLSRNDVSGLAIALEWYLGKGSYTHDNSGSLKFGINRLKAMACMGGNFDFAENKEKGGVKGLAEVSVFTLPMFVSYTYGYDADIAQFGKQNHSFSIGLIFNSFKTPIALTGGGLN